MPKRYRCHPLDGLKLLTIPQVDMQDKTFTSLLDIIAARDSCIAISSRVPLYTTLFATVAILTPTWVIEMETGQIEESPKRGTIGGGGLQQGNTAESAVPGIAPLVHQEVWIPLRNAP